MDQTTYRRAILIREAQRRVLIARSDFWMKPDCDAEYRRIQRRIIALVMQGHD